MSRKIFNLNSPNILQITNSYIPILSGLEGLSLQLLQKKPTNFSKTPMSRLYSSVSSNQLSSDSKAYNHDTKKAKTTPFYGEPRNKSRTYNKIMNSSTIIDPNMLSSPIQKLAIAIHSATTAFSDPKRADAVAALGEVTGHVALTQMYNKMMIHPTGQKILQKRPIVDEKTIPSNPKENSFGYAYKEFMSHHNFDPNERSPVEYISDPELSYVMLRYRQCHDFWHVLTGLPPSVFGELVLKWIELIQFNIPVAALSVTVGSLRLSSEERRILLEVYLPYAVRVGQNAEFLLNVYYEELFDENLDYLREQLRIEVAPKDIIIN